MIDFLIQKTPDKILLHHILQTRALVTVTQILHNDKLAQFLVKRHTIHNHLHFCQLRPQYLLSGAPIAVGF